MPIQTLIDAMEQLIAGHANLFQTAQNKTEAIKANDLGSLTALLREEQKHLTAIQVAEQKRQVAVANFGIKDATVSDIIETLDDPERHQLAQLQTRLVALLEDVKQVNALNQQLLEYSLQLIQLNLDMLSPDQDPGNYSKTQEPSIEQPVRSAFDSKA